MFRAALLALAMSLLLGLAPATAEAHAIIVASSPAPKAVVQGPDLLVKLDFNSRIDKARSVIELIAPDTTSRHLPITESTDDGTLTADAKGLTQGAWRLRWQVLSVDGHITRGDIPFTVAPAP
jgi:hypothetical protein